MLVYSLYTNRNSTLTNRNIIPYIIMSISIQTYGYQRGEGWEEINWEFGVKRYTLLYIK